MAREFRVRRVLLRMGIPALAGLLALPMAAAGAAVIEAPIWVRTVQAPGTVDRASAVAVDPGTGHVYTVGYSADTYGIVAYDDSGSVLWRDTRTRPGTGLEDVSATVDPGTGNVYFTGSRYNTMAYTAMGRRLWDSRYQTTGSSRTLAVDDGVVFVTGVIYDPATSTDALTLAYGSAGQLLWEQRYDREGGATNSAMDLAVDEVTGAVFITGSVDRAFGVPDGGDYVTVAYSRSGEQLWQALYSGSEDIRGDLAMAIAVDSTRGRVYVTGDVVVDDQSPAGTVAYDLAGHQIWDRTYLGPYGDGVVSRAMVVDETSGTSCDDYGDYNGTHGDVATVVYNSTGRQVGEALFTGRGSTSQFVRAATLDAEHGVAYVAVSSNDPAALDSADAFVLGYEARGAEVFRGGYAAPGQQRAIRPAGVAVDPQTEQVYLGATKLNGPQGLGTTTYEATTVAFAAG